MLRSCSQLEQLEIASFQDSTGKTPASVSGHDLSVISQLQSLKRLTLSDLTITDGRFLEDVMQCKLREAISLSNPLPFFFSQTDF